MVEPWRLVFRASAPLLPRAGLMALREALAEDDPALLQKTTTAPPLHDLFAEWPVEGACPWAFCHWKTAAEPLEVHDLEHWFGEFCTAVDETLGEYAGCGYFLRWIDDTPRAEMRAALLDEVTLYLSQTEETAP